MRKSLVVIQDIRKIKQGNPTEPGSRGDHPMEVTLKLKRVTKGSPCEDFRERAYLLEEMAGGSLSF